MNPQTIHDTAKQLVIDTEVFLCADKYADWPKLDVLKRYGTRWWKFLKMGIAILTRPFSIYVFLAFGLIFLVVWFASAAKITDPKIFSVLLLAAEILPIFVVAFALPSTYGDRALPKDLPTGMSAYLRDGLGVTSVKQAEAVKKSIKLFEESAKNRITVMKWLFGLCWAGFVYLATKFWEISIGKGMPFKEILSIFNYFLVGAVFVFFGYLLVWGYAAAVEKLFLSIEVGTNQAIIDLETEAIKS